MRLYLRPLASLEAKPVRGKRGRALRVLVARRQSARLLRRQPAEAAGARLGSACHRSARCGRGPGSPGPGEPTARSCSPRSRETPSSRVKSEGGEPREGARARRRGTACSACRGLRFCPTASATSTCRARPIGAYRIMLGEPGREPREVRTADSFAHYVAPGYLVFARDGTLARTTLRRGSRAGLGRPDRVAEPVAEFASPGWAAFAVSPNGVLAYRLGRRSGAPRRGSTARAAASPSRTLASALWVRFSPDGRRALFNRADPRTGNLDIWALDVARGVETPSHLRPRHRDLRPAPARRQPRLLGAARHARHSSSAATSRPARRAR